MIQNDAKIKAKRFLTEYNLKSVNLETLRNVLTRQGYILIEFNSIFNDPDITKLINSLGIEKAIEQSKGFTYVDQYRRLVFLNEDLSNDEKLVVLAHEMGHIYCNHFTSTPIIGKDVAEEHEANEFSHYILNPPFLQKTRITIHQHKKIVVFSTLICLLIIGGVLIWGTIQKEQSYYGEYYLTESGNKYHKEECIFIKDKTNVRRMTVEEFESGEYEPCKMCLPD